jgi:hypothetical protein
MPNYSCHEYRTLLDPEPRRLQPWEECWGMLHELREQDSQLLATIAGLVVALPLELRERLEALRCHSVAIIRTDHDYRLRCPDHGQKLRP